MNHTPTPWKIENDWIVSEDGTVDVSPVTDSLMLSDGECEANAAFIVRCCNNHETALSLLNSAMEETQNESLKGRIAAFLATDKA